MNQWMQEYGVSEEDLQEGAEELSMDDLDAVAGGAIDPGFVLNIIGGFR